MGIDEFILIDKVIGVITLVEFPGIGGDTANYLEIMKQIIQEGFQGSSDLSQVIIPRWKSIKSRGS